MQLFDFLFPRPWALEAVETPLVPAAVTALQAVDALSRPNLVFQPSAQGLALRPRENFYRDFRWLSENPRDFSELSCRPSHCPVQPEVFDFNDGVIASAPPTAPAVNCFAGRLPDRYGWFDSTLSMPGASRVARTYRPETPVSALRPLVIWFHGTGGGSDSLSHDLFDEDEAHRVFGNQAFIFILEARDGMPEEDWEHVGFSYTRFWNTTADRGESNRDLLWVDALIRAAIRNYGADPNRVFLMGHSNGGFAATQYGIALRDRVRGVAVSSAGWVEHPPKRRRTFDTTDCARILEQGRDFFARIDERFPQPRPVSVFPSDSLPAFFIRGNSRDRDVSAHSSCLMDRELRARGGEVSTRIIDWRNPDDPSEGFHFVDRAFLREAWAYLGSLPGRRGR